MRASLIAFIAVFALCASNLPALADCEAHKAAAGEAACEGKGEKSAGACEGKAGAAAAASVNTAALEAAPGEALYVLKIEGMSCSEACPPNVKQSIESIEGVRGADVSFADKQATVRTDESLELTAAEVDKAFNNQGYFVSSVQKISAK